jgi:hypothetical protein
MSKRFVAILLITLMYALAGCVGVNPATNAAGRTLTPVRTPTLPAGTTPLTSTATPSLTPTEMPYARLTNNCLLLDSRDIAGLFSSYHAEVMKPVHQVSQLNHVIFSAENVSATESSCIFYAFHQPGSMNGEMLQVTYWVDVPDQATASAWATVWADAKSKAQVLPGIGEDAFYDHGRLTFKEGNVYVTLEAVGSRLNVDTQASATQQIAIEKQLALDASNRVSSS